MTCTAAALKLMFPGLRVTLKPDEASWAANEALADKMFFYYLALKTNGRFRKNAKHLV